MNEKECSQALHLAKRKKADEFYTDIKDIREELKHHKKSFEGKVIYCNCDDPRESNFFRYFFDNFKELKLSKLIATHFIPRDDDLFGTNSNPAPTIAEVTQENDTLYLEVRELEGDGSFDSAECIKYLKEADIVVTNPPFSLYRAYLKFLFLHKKDFLLLAPTTIFSNRDLFNYIKNKKLTCGYTANSMGFATPYREKKAFVSCLWLTTLPVCKKQAKQNYIELKAEFTEENYPFYDNYYAREVSNIADLPKNYYGLLGVPLSVFWKVDLENWELVDMRNPRLNNKSLFKRILIKKIN